MKLVTLFLVLSFSIFGFANAKEWHDPVTGMQFVWVPGGSFEMGCPAMGEKCARDQKPARIVRLDGFWLGKFEVTQGQWKRVMGNNPSWFKKGNDYPVEQVSWKDVQKFLGRLNSQAMAIFRLPSEAQWEYACQGWEKFVANDIYSENLNRKNKGTTPVARYKPNLLGIHEMAGNVMEWVQDQYSDYGNTGSDNPIIENDHSNPYRVIRGGLWIDPDFQCFQRHRDHYSGGGRGVGFRLVRIK